MIMTQNKWIIADHDSWQVIIAMLILIKNGKFRVEGLNVKQRASDSYVIPTKTILWINNTSEKAITGNLPVCEPHHHQDKEKLRLQWLKHVFFA